MNYRAKLADEVRTHNFTVGITEEECYKTPCTCAVLAFFGIGKDQFKFCQTIPDMRRIFKRNGWKTIKQKLSGTVLWPELNQKLSRGFYLLSLESHVLLIYVPDSGEMRVDVDTSPNYKLNFPTVEEVFKIELERK